MALAGSPMASSTSATPFTGSPSLSHATIPPSNHGASSSKAGPSGSNKPPYSSIILSPQLMSSFKPAKVFRDQIGQHQSYTSLSYDDRGEQLITAGEDDQIQLFNCRSGKHQRLVKAGKYGVHLTRFTHKSTTVISASTKGPDEAANAIRYLSLHNNTYLRYFQGHRKPVTSLEMSPADDTFLSAAADDTVRLWDLKSATCQGLLNLAGVASVAYDPSGLIFAVTTNLRSTTLLYDVRKLDVEPFAEVVIRDPILETQARPQQSMPIYTSVKFSNDGNYLLVGTTAGIHYVLHSFNYNVVARLEGPKGLGGDANETVHLSGEETTWTPDSRYVLSGSADGRIYIYDVNPPAAELATQSTRPPSGENCTLEPIKILEGHKNSASRVVKFNPRYSQFASAGTGELAMWLSDPPKDTAAPDAH